MKQKILKNRGALQENLTSDSHAPQRRMQYAQRNLSPAPMAALSMSNVIQQQAMIPPEDSGAYPSYVDEHNSGIYQVISGPPTGGSQSTGIDPFTGRREPTTAMEGGGGGRHSLDSHMPEYQLKSEYEGMFYTTIPEGQQALISDKEGRGELVKGPARVWTRKKKVQWLQHHIAYPGEFLIVKHRDGTQKHVPGPAELWLDPRKYSGIEKEDVVQIAAKEAVVVYSQNDDGKVDRRIVEGPAIFIPSPGEWLHTFSWHGSRGQASGYKKVPGGLRFQKLWLMPDQMYHDVDDVRTADDVVLTVRLMMFFELSDVERMLVETHDPIGDFINAASSDVLDLVGRYTFDEFKGRTEMLNNLDNYGQLAGRASQVGYKLHKLVYRGYATSEALERMHEQAIETRTRLKLERETENQAQELADFKQQREYQRDTSSRSQEKEKEVHEMEKQQRRHEQQANLQRERKQQEREQRQLDAQQELSIRQEYLDQWTALNAKLRELDVDLTAYLTQNRADQVIELRGQDNQPIAPHLHMPQTPQK